MEFLEFENIRILCVVCTVIEVLGEICFGYCQQKSEILNLANG